MDHCHSAEAERGERVLSVDRAIAKKYERTVSPVVIDMAGFTESSINHGIMHYLSMIEKIRSTLVPLVEQGGGTVVKLEADNLFAHFDSVAPVLAATQRMHQRLYALNLTTEDEFEIGIAAAIGFGPTLLLGNDMWGTEFNITCKLGEDTAQRGETYLTQAALQDIGEKDLAAHGQIQERTILLGGTPQSVYLLKFAPPSS